MTSLTPSTPTRPSTAGAAEVCAERGWHVGLDALSPDPSPSETGAESASESAGEEPDGVPAHRELLGGGLFFAENPTGLGGLPERFELRTYPLALADADGSPVRAVARW